MKLRRKIALGFVAILLLVPTAVTYVVVTTESGLQFVVSRLGKIGPVTITAGTVTGTLAYGFSVDSLRIQHRLSDVQIDHASGSIELLPLLLLHRITMPGVRAEHVSVMMKLDPLDRPLLPPRFLPALLRIDTDAAHVDGAEITLLSGRKVPLRNIDGKVTVLPKQIRILSSKLDYELMHIQATGNVLAKRPIGLDGEMEITWSIAGQPDWLILARFDGDLDKLPLTGRIEKPFHAGFEGAVTTLNKGWKFAGKAQVQDLNLQPFGGGTVLGIISGTLDITAASVGFAAKGSLTPPGLKAGALGVDFHGAYSQRVLTIQRATVTHATSGARATTHGTVTIVKGGPQLDLAGDWATFRWPLAESAPAFSSPRGNYALSGVKPWAVRLDGDVITAEQPAMPATLRGALATDSLRIDEAAVQLLGGTANFTGEARWQPAESWRVDGSVADLDPSTLRADLPGKLGFDFKASGAPFGAMGSLDLDAQRFTGKLRGQNISGKGHFARAAASTDWQFTGVDLSLGRTRLQLDGGFGVQSDLRFVVNADDLSLFDPAASGRVSASGRYAGTRATPLLLFKARGTDFEWQGYKVAALDADVDVDLRADGHALGQINTTGLTYGGRTVQKASLKLTGNGEQHRLALDVEATPLRTALVAQGAIREGLWQGTLESLVIDDSRNLQLRLETPATLAFNLQQQQLGQTCVKGTVERLCMAGQRLPDGTWKANLTAESLPLRALTAGLMQDMEYEGTINLQADLAGNRTDLPVGNLRGQLQQARLLHRLSNGKFEPMSLGSGSVTANATTTGFAVQVGLDAGDSGSIKGALTGERNAGDWQSFPIRGTLDANTDGLGLLDIYFGGIDKATGRLITKVSIGGTLGAPTLQGLLQLRDASIDVYQVNIAMRELSLDANFNNDSLDIEGQSRLGTGIAKFNGKLAWKEREPYGNLHVEGENLRIVDVPEARINASPKLDFKIDGRRIDVSGEIRLPYAQLEPADLRNVVLASNDEQMVGAPVIDPAQRWLVIYDVRVMLGDQVRIDSLGLKARLGGSIRVRGDDSKVIRGEGELNIAEGKFQYLGRLLDIERGRLIFDNGPLNNPGVDLRAQKVFPDITAGVNVRGTLLHLNPPTFFSEPAIPQSQIVSLILAGGSLESVQNSNRSGAARNDMLAQGASILAQRVGARVGVDDVGIETDLSNDTSLVLGKYLSPRLYVSYGISLAEAINTLKMRFTIGDRWTIKTEAGKARSADIVYTIQK
ncbi:MAG: translocation/assembly module TamB domain-containing protein [Steroidobacteraceae bacterium]